MLIAAFLSIVMLAVIMLVASKLNVTMQNVAIKNTVVLNVVIHSAVIMKLVWWPLVGIISCLIQGKEDGIQVLAGLDPSSQTVACIIGDTGVTKGGSCQ